MCQEPFLRTLLNVESQGQQVPQFALLAEDYVHSRASESVGRFSRQKDMYFLP